LYVDLGPRNGLQNGGLAAVVERAVIEYWDENHLMKWRYTAQFLTDQEYQDRYGYLGSTTAWLGHRIESEEPMSRS
jgi:hypothetical protein